MKCIDCPLYQTAECPVYKWTDISPSPYDGECAPRNMWRQKQDECLKWRKRAEKAEADVKDLEIEMFPI